MSRPLTSLYQEELYTIPALQVIVVVTKPWGSFSFEEKALLSKILSSVKLDLAMIKVIELTKASVDQLKALHASKVIIFGTEVEGLKSYEHFMAQGFSVIKADDLSALDDAKKKSLWVALRAMFGI